MREMLESTKELKIFKVSSLPDDSKIIIFSVSIILNVSLIKSPQILLISIVLVLSLRENSNS